MSEKIVTIQRGRGTWQGPESKAPVMPSAMRHVPTITTGNASDAPVFCNDGPQLAALGLAGQQMPHVVYEPYPGAFDHLLGGEDHTPSGNPISQQIRQKLERFAECVDDGEDVDIGRDWIDALTTLGLLEKYRISPARWCMTSAGEAYLGALPAQVQPAAAAVKVKPLAWVAITDSDCDFEAFGMGYRYWFKLDDEGIVLQRGAMVVGVEYSVEAAKAAAQADYKARLLAEIEVTE